MYMCIYKMPWWNKPNQNESARINLEWLTSAALSNNQIKSNLPASISFNSRILINHTISTERCWQIYEKLSSFLFRSIFVMFDKVYTYIGQIHLHVLYIISYFHRFSLDVFEQTTFDLTILQQIFYINFKADFFSLSAPPLSFSLPLFLFYYKVKVSSFPIIN